MKKIVPIILALSFFNITSNTQANTSHTPTHIIGEALFKSVLRDFLLLDSWLEHNHYTHNHSKKRIEALRFINQKKILHLYQVDREAFQASLIYYVGGSVPRALNIYKNLSSDLAALLPNK